MTKRVSMTMRMAPLFVALFALLSTMPGAFAQTGGAPGNGLKIIPTQWTKRCFKQSNKDVCLTLIDRYVSRPDGQPVWIGAAALREVKGEKAKQFTVRVPLGVYLQEGVIYSIDKGKAKRAPFSVCMRQGCQSIFAATPELLKSLKKGGELRLQVTSATGKKVQVPFSLKGFTKANKSKPTPIAQRTAPQAKAPRLRKSTKGDAPAQ